MLDNKKIQLMSRLAIYDKKYGAADRKKGGYFKWDYVYFKNFWTRTGVLFGCLILAVFYILEKLLVDQADILAIDYKFEATKIGFFTILALIIYTIIGTVVAKGEYKKSRHRTEAYFAMLDKLDELNRGEGDYRGADDIDRKAPPHSEMEFESRDVNIQGFDSGYYQPEQHEWEQNRMQSEQREQEQNRMKHERRERERSDAQPDRDPEKYYQSQQNRQGKSSRRKRKLRSEAKKSDSGDKSIDQLKRLKEVKKRNGSNS